MQEVVIFLVILIPFFLFAIIFSNGKGAFLLAGYNTMSDSEKAQYNEVKLCKFMGKMMYGICFCIILFALSVLIENQIVLICAICFFLALIIFSLVYANTGNRFKKF